MSQIKRNYSWGEHEEKYKNEGYPSSRRFKGRRLKALKVTETGTSCRVLSEGMGNSLRHSFRPSFLFEMGTLLSFYVGTYG